MGKRPKRTIAHNKSGKPNKVSQWATTVHVRDDREDALHKKDSLVAAAVPFSDRSGELLTELLASDHPDKGSLVENQIKGMLEGTFCGLKTEITQTRMFSYGEDGVVVQAAKVQGRLVNSEGKQVGYFDRVFYDNGTIQHRELSLDAIYQGNGFATEWLEHCEDEYRAAGFERYTLEAAANVGGYAWASAGMGWDQERSDAAASVVHRIDRVLDAYDQKDTREQAMLLSGRPLPDAEEPLGFYPFPFQNLRMLDDPQDRQALREIAHMIRTRPMSEWPPPASIAMVGKDRAQQVGDRKLWAGKVMMLGAQWFAERRL